MSFESRKASRGSVKPVIAFYSESGGGKSLSALYLARGLVGPNGNIQLVDTEAGRGELYSDVVPGGYNVIPFAEPFSPARYIEAIRAAENAGADVIIIDQASSEWEGISGVLDMASTNEESGKRGLAVWKTPKMEHAKWVVRLLQSKCPIIVCLRAKYKSRQVKQNGRTEIVRDEYLTPIQDESFIFETTVHGYMTQDHAFHPVKISHPELQKCFPKGQPITVEHGQMLARWCANPGTGGQSPQTKVESKPAVPSPKAGGGSSTPAIGSQSATPEQRQRMFSAFQQAGIDEAMLKSFAEHKAWLAPFDELGDWPLDHTPTKMAQMTALIEEVNQWKAGATA